MFSLKTVNDHIRQVVECDKPSSVELLGGAHYLVKCFFRLSTQFRKAYSPVRYSGRGGLGKEGVCLRTDHRLILSISSLGHCSSQTRHISKVWYCNVWSENQNGGDIVFGGGLRLPASCSFLDSASGSRTITAWSCSRFCGELHSRARIVNTDVSHVAVCRSSVSVTGLCACRTNLCVHPYKAP